MGFFIFLFYTPSRIWLLWRSVQD